MKKVGIITINDLDNYGNRLQCYALQEYLKMIGVNTENIYNYNQSLKNKILVNGKKTLNSIIKFKEYRNRKLRKKSFKIFNENIKFSKEKILLNKYSKNINELYDYFIVGSDQVWNTRFETIVSKTDFLNFASPNKRISYAASFGTSEFASNFKSEYFNEISKFKAISVREETGKIMLEDKIKRSDIEVLIDPTMLISADKWSSIANKPKMLNESKYILCYFLGELSDMRKNEIKRIAKENNYEIINILDKKDKYFTTGPSEFLYLEKNAELVCTDSFHSSVFAMLFNRPFIIFDREDSHANMNSRLETLISKFNLKNRKYNGEKITEENLNHDYSEAYKILEVEREKSKKFLEKALDIEDNK